MSRHNPATPTSTKRDDATPAKASVRAASPATATSEVPPQTIATRVPACGGGNAPRMAVREISS